MTMILRQESNGEIHIHASATDWPALRDLWARVGSALVALDPDKKAPQVRSQAKRRVPAAVPPQPQAPNLHADLLAEIATLFGGEYMAATPWLLKSWTTRNTAENIRTTADALTQEELTQLIEQLRTKADYIKTQWATHSKPATTTPAPARKVNRS